MRKTIPVLFLLLGIALSGVTRADENSFSLTSKTGTLSLNAKGLTFVSTDPVLVPSIIGNSAEPFWNLVLLEAAGNPLPSRKILLTSTDQKYELLPCEDGYKISYRNLVKDNEIYEIGLVLNFKKKGDGFVVTSEIRNGTKDWSVFEFDGPVFRNISLDIAKFPLLIPDGFGLRLDTPPDGEGLAPPSLYIGWKKNPNHEWEYTTRYPGLRGTLQYFLFAGEKSGLYFGVHDPNFGVKKFTVLYNSQSKTWSTLVRHYPCLPPGAVWNHLLVEFRSYQGSWHKAADYYRAWVDSTGYLVKTPTWPNSLAGMMLCIMKQQNGRHVMWTYDDIGKSMSDCADRYGFNFLALFGWAHGGHDYLYPEYFPDKLLGGEEGLRKGIAEAHARGKKVYLYTNGQLMDLGNERFWPTTGKSLSMVLENGKLWTQNWQKFTDQPGFTHSLACPHDPRWCAILLDLAKKANDYGSDGILYDQIGTGSPGLCFAANHGHPVPMTVRGDDNARLLKTIADEMHRINPEFAILTEGLNEAELSSISYFHGCELTFHGVGTKADFMPWIDGAKGAIPFDALFRYTYPDVKISLRNPNPLEYRRNVNYAAVFAIDHEIEVRYPTDVNCVKKQIMPTVASYQADCVLGLDQLKNDLRTLKEQTPEESIQYLKSVFEFQRANESILIRGKFVDTLGFNHTGPVLAKAFQQGRMLGVIVWNPDDKPVDFSVTVPDGRFLRASSPEERDITDPFKSLNADSLRLLVWELP